MRIQVTITPPDSTTPFILGDDSAARVLTGRNWPNGAGGAVNDGFLGNQARVIYKANTFRGPYVTNIARALLDNSFPLRVTRSFDTETNHVWFIATHADAVPANGLLTVNISTSDSKIALYLASVVIGNISRVKHEGVKSEWTYPINGNGPWLTANPST